MIPKKTYTLNLTNPFEMKKGRTKLSNSKLLFFVRSFCIF
jgi:hypothetical protein